MTSPVEQVRRFNRTVTRRIGALDGHFLGRGRSLGACRVLFEIGSTTAPEPSGVVLLLLGLSATAVTRRRS